MTAGSKGFVNKAKSGARASVARREQRVARAQLDRRPPPARSSRPRPGRTANATPASPIEVEHNPQPERLAELGVLGWPIWTKERSTFPWHYDAAETCYFLEGDVEVVPDGGEPLRIGRGDLVRFPEGLSCTWHVRTAVRKHYRFES